MIRASIFAATAIALTLTLGTGCDNKAGDDQQKANAAQAEANKKIAEANNEAVTKTTAAQVEADKKIATAEGDFGKRREDYRHEVKKEQIELDKKIDLLEAKAKTATGKAKTDLDTHLTQIRASRASFNRDFGSLETTTAVQWDSTKAKMDQQWTELKKLVDKAN